MLAHRELVAQAVGAAVKPVLDARLLVDVSRPLLVDRLLEALDGSLSAWIKE